MKRSAWLGVLYRGYLALCQTPLSPNFLFFYPLYPRVRRQIRAFCHGTVLEVGSGFAPFQQDLQRQAKRYFSLDYPASSELAPFSAAPPHPETHIWADAACLPLRDRTVDVILCTSVLEHAQQFQRIVEECHRVLRDGGIIIGSVPFAHTLHMEPFDFYRFSAYAITQLADATGFEVVHLEPIGRGFHALGACLADLCIRNIAGLRSNSVTSMGIVELSARAVLLMALYPVILLANIVAPLLDGLLPQASLPLHYVFVFRRSLPAPSGAASAGVTDGQQAPLSMAR